jgi:hypothetical protein
MDFNFFLDFYLAKRKFTGFKFFCYARFQNQNFKLGIFP